MKDNRNEIINCPFCDRKIHTNVIQRHVDAKHSEYNWKYITKRERNLPGKYQLNHDGLICQYCGKEHKNRNSLCNHERLCKKNPNRQISPFSIEGGKKGFSPNKGKTKETSESIRKWVDTYRKNEELGLHKSHSHLHTKETKESISKTMSEKELGGIKAKRFEYKGESLQSSYELLVAKDLDNNNVKWEKCHRAFPYIDCNEIKRHYIPDFYLPEYNVYLDPKNDYLINDYVYEGFTTKDKIRWVQELNDIKILILDKNHLTWDKIKNLILG